MAQTNRNQLTNRSDERAFSIKLSNHPEQVSFSEKVQNFFAWSWKLLLPEKVAAEPNLRRNINLVRMNNHFNRVRHLIGLWLLAVASTTALGMHVVVFSPTSQASSRAPGIMINEHSEIADNRIVDIRLLPLAMPERVFIADNPGMRGAGEFPFADYLQWDLCAGMGGAFYGEDCPDGLYNRVCAI